MKKVLLLLVCLFTLQTVVWADDDKPIQVNQLPQTAQTFIKTHFPDNTSETNKCNEYEIWYQV